MGEPTAPATRSSDGVYYSRHDYASFWRRVCVDVVDVTCLFIAVVLVTSVLGALLPGGERILPDILFCSGVIMAFFYLVVLKRSPFRTVGYRLGRVRIVTLDGLRPSVWTLTKRVLFIFPTLVVFLGPIVDIIWVPCDRHRQALRDKFARTYVIRDHAVPEGHGPVCYATYTLLGMGFTFGEVKSR